MLGLLIKRRIDHSLKVVTVGSREMQAEGR
jgi:hypothetical protein